MNNKLVDLIRENLLAFSWGNYGLDNVEDAEPDWATDLAVEIAVAITDKVEVEL